MPAQYQQMRVSDAERQAVADRLAEHFGEGRLDHAEFDSRISRAMSAKTRADLSGLLDDLPETGAPAVPQRPRPRRRHPVLGLVLLAVIIVAAANAVLHAVVPLLWVGLLVAALLVAVRAAGRFRPRHDRLPSLAWSRKPGRRPPRWSGRSRRWTRY